MAIPFREKPEYIRGDKAQHLIAEWLKGRGCYVIPSYDYSGDGGNKAPRMEGASASYVLPDLDCAKNGKRWWAEVKAKRSANLWRKTQTWEHGIDKRHYEHYMQAQKITGSHVWLFIFEEDTQSILAESFDRLGTPRYGSQYGKGGMVNWPRGRFSICVSAGSVPGLITVPPSPRPLTAQDIRF